ncbi:uncharacterized protein LOC115638205 [Gopherus evgoodei]|uniref:uncharacterized protein LOC115638205 n=1 Tax=Gopherus evgoodei TaxID=1825980 RepID=UPI0011CFA9F1|nr:uncharacterized protein LOC115638205 [Gopherus evgoodei]
MKMAISRNFTKIWKKHFSLISPSVYSLFLVVLEKMLESDFKCPEELHLRRSYIILLFIMPAVLFFILGIILQPECLHPSVRKKEFYYFYNKCKRHNKCKSDSTDKHEFSSCWCVLLKASFPAVLWIVILLLDGRYTDCFSENITEYQIFQLLGLVIIFAAVCIGSICKCCCKKGYKEKVAVDKAEINQLEQKAREYMLKQKEDAIQQRVKDEYGPEIILIYTDNKKLSDIINEVCKISGEGNSADQGSIGTVSISPQGTSSQSPQETSSQSPQETSSPLHQGTSNLSPQVISENTSYSCV